MSFSTPRLGRPKTSGPRVSAGSPGLRSVVGFLVCVELVSGMLQGYYGPLLAGFGAALHVGAGPLNWFSSVHLLAAAVCVPVFAALGDHFGHRRLLSVAVWAVAAGSLLIVVAPAYPVVLLGRALQGPLAAWIALEIALVRDKASGPRADRAIGLLAGSLTAGLVLGGLVSGPLEALLGGVRAALAVPVVLSALCGLVTKFLIPESSTRSVRKIDWTGAAGLSVALALVLLGLSQASRTGWGAGSTIAALGSGIVVLAGWVWWERRVPGPLVDMRLFASRAMWPAMLATLLFGVCFFGNQVPLVTFLATKPAVAGYGFGLSAKATSLVLALNFLAAVAGSTVYGRIATRVGTRGVLSTGIGLSAAGFLSMALLHGTLGEVLAALVATGLGMGLLLAGLPAYLSGAAPADQVGIASGTYSTVKVLGGSVATAVVGTLLSSFLSDGAEGPAETGYTVVWTVCAGCAALGLLVLALAWARREHSTPHEK
ncbi:MFS transporter [Amycolatopsis orientalis]|uniref:MFS transporter n=1 Tax=Amycolatopsis orientalis TaxID=31958 RepID=UPI0003A801E2|nr:MFS transporter [Amycolatopsis orientalis]